MTHDLDESFGAQAEDVSIEWQGLSYTNLGRVVHRLLAAGFRITCQGPIGNTQGLLTVYLVGKGAPEWTVSLTDDWLAAADVVLRAVNDPTRIRQWLESSPAE